MKPAGQPDKYMIYIDKKANGAEQKISAGSGEAHL